MTTRRTAKDDDASRQAWSSLFCGRQVVFPDATPIPIPPLSARVASLGRFWGVLGRPMAPWGRVTLFLCMGKRRGTLGTKGTLGTHQRGAEANPTTTDWPPTSAYTNAPGRSASPSSRLPVRLDVELPNPDTLDVHDLHRFAIGE